MEVKITQQELLHGLKRIYETVSGKGLEYVFQLCLIETIGNNRIKISATNMHQTIAGEYPCEVKTDGKVCINARILIDIVKLLDEADVYLKLDLEYHNEDMEEGDVIFVQCNKSSFHIVLCSVEEYLDLTKTLKNKAANIS